MKKKDIAKALIPLLKKYISTRSTRTPIRYTSEQEAAVNILDDLLCYLGTKRWNILETFIDKQHKNKGGNQS